MVGLRLPWAVQIVGLFFYSLICHRAARLVWAREYRLSPSTRVAGLNRQVMRGSFMFHFNGS